MDGTVSAQKGRNPIGIIERPVKFGTGIDPAQHRDAQSIGIGQRLALCDIHQFHQQAVLNEWHQHPFGDFAEMTTQGTEQLAFRRHGS